MSLQYREVEGRETVQFGQWLEFSKQQPRTKITAQASGVVRRIGGRSVFENRSPVFRPTDRPTGLATKRAPMGPVVAAAAA